MKKSVFFYKFIFILNFFLSFTLGFFAFTHCARNFGKYRKVIDTQEFVMYIDSIDSF